VRKLISGSVSTYLYQVKKTATTLVLRKGKHSFEGYVGRPVFPSII